MRASACDKGTSFMRPDFFFDRAGAGAAASGINSASVCSGTSSAHTGRHWVIQRISSACLQHCCAGRVVTACARQLTTLAEAGAACMPSTMAIAVHDTDLQAAHARTFRRRPRPAVPGMELAAAGDKGGAAFKRALALLHVFRGVLLQHRLQQHLALLRMRRALHTRMHAHGLVRGVPPLQ